MKKRMDRIIRHPLFSGSMVLFFGSNFANFLISLYHFVMGNMLGPSSYGELAVIISLCGFLGVIPAAVNLVVIKYISIAKDDTEIAMLIRWLRKRVLIITLIFSFGIIAISPFVSSFLHINKILYFVIIAIAFFFSTQSFFNRSILQGLLQFKQMIISILGENISKLLISAGLVYLGFGVSGALGGFMISLILGWYVTTRYLQYHNKHADVEIDLKQVVSFTGPVLVQSIALTSLYSSDVILVKHFFSSFDAGIYAALSTLGKIIFFGTGPIGAVMFPLVSQRHSRGEEYRKIFIFSLLATLMLASFVLIVYWLLPGFVINLLYGTAYLKASGLLIWFGTFITLFSVAALFISFYLSLGYTEVVLLPLAASIAQIIVIWFYHDSLLTVVIISIAVTALLVGSLLIYSSYEKKHPRNNFNIGHSASL